MQFPLSVMKYFRALSGLIIAQLHPYSAQARTVIPLRFAAPGRFNHNRTGKQPMRMISEKAVAFILAIAFSGAAFNTLIV
ncbi:hypothetical protein [Erythrobacter sp.]|uniref:hypothetical protein n=1 Tax=Erythrobacter sp. TaxID=1042 RepID=UPI0025EE827F|nr:hypothetical protein [Erythrobacter sp.]